MIDLFGVNDSKFHSEGYIADLLIETVNHCNLNMIDHKSHQFDRQIMDDGEKGGTTFFVLLQESHVSIHTWPEEESLVIDIFTCGDPKKAYLAKEYLLSKIQYKTIELKEIRRGSI